MPQPNDLPVQAHVPAHSPQGRGHGTISIASLTANVGPDFSKYDAVWDHNYAANNWSSQNGWSQGTYDLNNHWGNWWIGPDEAVLSSLASQSYKINSGIMQFASGSSAGEGYGLYSVTAKIDPGEGPGAFACLWPASNIWPGPEIDLFEKASQSDFSGYSTIHWKGADGKDQYQAFDFPEINVSKPHTYLLEWAADHLALYINNAENADQIAPGSPFSRVYLYTDISHIPQAYDAATGKGENETLGVGMQADWAAAQQNGDNYVHIYDAKYYAPVSQTPTQPPSSSLPTVSVGDASTTEGGQLTFTVTLSAASTQTVTVAYTTADGTALVSDSDYTAKSGTLTIAAGATTQTVMVQTTQDTKVEPDQTLYLRLSSPTNATITDGEGLGTIRNDDTAPPPTTTGKTIVGKNGPDTLTGTDYNDTITGGRGNDTMSGGNGADVFHLSVGDGFDRIKDFTTGVDDLVFHGVTSVSSKVTTYSGVKGLDVSYGSRGDHVFLEHYTDNGAATLALADYSFV